MKLGRFRLGIRGLCPQGVSGPWSSSPGQRAQHRLTRLGMGLDKALAQGVMLGLSWAGLGTGLGGLRESLPTQHILFILCSDYLYYQIRSEEGVLIIL